MPILDREIAAPARTIETTQIDNGFDGRDHFVFDVACTDRPEVYDVLGEVVHGDIYDLQRVTRPGDVWVDAGCHVGLFSIAAMMAGADVSVMIDMENDMAWCAEYNARQFMRQQLIRGDHQTRRLMPTAVVERLTDVDQLVRAGMLAREHWDGLERSCLKLDVQGAERDMLREGGWAKLASAFDIVVMEWHYPVVPYQMEYEGWRVSRQIAHHDVLLRTDTHIVWAHSG